MSTRKCLLSLCLIGVVGLSLGNGCPPSTPLTGDTAAGQALFNQSCVGCHTAAFLKATQNNIINNLGTLNAQMAGLTLTNQQIADLKAFLATQ